MVLCTMSFVSRDIIVESLFLVALSIGAYAYLFHHITRHREKPEALDKITPHSDCKNVNLDIVAVHGLGAHPYFTWTSKGPGGRINWLEDDNFLKHDFEDVRILSYAYNADWFMDAPVSTPSETARMFLQKLLQFRERTKKTPPILFIGHSFGGIIVKYAIQKAKSDSNFKDIGLNTAGVIFLGTPHRGSSISLAGQILAQLTPFSGSDATLLKLLRRHSSALQDLKDNFSDAVGSVSSIPKSLKVYSFYETLPTLVYGISLGIIVERESATLDFGERISVNTNHSGLNKCKAREDDLYEKIRDTIEKVKSSLQQDIGPISQWIIGSEDTKRHERDHERARMKLREYNNLGDWLFKSHDFQEWRSSSSCLKPVFWLRGGVGTGKTSVASEIIEQLWKTSRQKESQKIVYVYCHQGYSIDSMLRSIILQLAISTNSSRVQPLIADKFNFMEQASVNSEDYELIARLCGEYSEAMIIIDALDECSEPRRLLNALQKIHEGASENTKLFLSSRLHIDVEDVFPRFYGVSIDENSAMTDMHRFIDAEVDLRYNFPRRWNGRNFRDRLKDALKRHAKGMFRWVELQLDIFFDEHPHLKTETDVENDLKILESGASIPGHSGDQKAKLNREYERLLNYHGNDARNIVTSALRWLLFSRRPFKVEQLVEATIISQEHVLNKPTYRGKINLNPQGVRQLCSNLIVFGHNTSPAEFSHHSVKEYLLDPEYCKDNFTAETCHAFMAEICLWYIYERSIPVSEILDSYIYTNVLPHCSGAGSNKRRQGQLRSLLRFFYEQPLDLLAKGRKLMGVLEDLETSIKIRSCLDLFYALQLTFSVRHYALTFITACVFNLDDVIPTCLSQDLGDPNAKELLIRKGLGLACENNCYEIVKELLDSDGKTSKEVPDIGTVYTAAQSSNEDIMEFVLQRCGQLDTEQMKWTIRFASGNKQSSKVLGVIKRHFHKFTEDLDAYEWATRMLRSNGVASLDFLLREVNGTFVTDEVVADALGERGSDESLAIILHHRPDLPITENLLIRAAGNEYDGDRAMDALIMHTQGNIRVSEKVLRAAALNDARGCLILDRLLKILKEDVNIPEEVVTSAAATNPHAYDIFEVLFKYRKDTNITKAVLLAAAKNKNNAMYPETIELLLCRNPNIPLTEDIVLAIVGNRRNGWTMIDYLLEERQSIHITLHIITAATCAAAFWDFGLQRLFDRYPEFQADEGVLEAAAGNTKCGEELVRALLDLNSGVKFGYRVVEAAARNAEEGVEILELIFQHAPDTEISNSLLATAAREGNSKGLDWLLNHIDESRVTNDLLNYLLEAAAACTTEMACMAVDVILRRTDITFPISESVLMALFRKYPLGYEIYHKDLIEALLKGNRPIVITEKVFERAASNCSDGFDLKIIEVFLERDKNLSVSDHIITLAITNPGVGCASFLSLLNRAQVKVTKEMLKKAAENDGECRNLTNLLLVSNADLEVGEILEPAARNERFRKDMFQKLLEHKRDTTITEEVLIAAAQSSGGSMDAILSYKPDIQISHAVLKAVASNERWKFFSIMQIILHRHSDIEITEDVMEAARNNATMGPDLTALLQKHEQSRSLSSLV